MPSSIFVVDSSPAVRRLVEQLSAPEGFEVLGFQDGPAALEAARQMHPALIIADYQLNNITFSGFCKEIHKLDHLAETSLISLINPADHPDEKLLRTLGVKAFLSKPVQSDDLLTIIKSIQQQQEVGNGKGLKRRTWPPASPEMDSDDDEAMNRFAASQPKAEQPLTLRSDSPRQAPTSPANTSGPEDAMKGLFDQLLQSMTKQTEKSLAELLPRITEEKLTSHIRPIIQQEVRAQLGEILSEEYLVSTLRPLLSQALPSLLEKELKTFEPIIKQSVSDMVGPVIKTTLDQRVREQAEATIQKYLPTVIHEQIGSIDQLVKDEIQAAVMKQVPLLADDLVRTVAENAVGHAVQQIIPGLAEQQIKAELKRLTSDPSPTAS